MDWLGLGWMAMPAHHAVQVRAYRQVQFEADGQAHAPCRAGSGGWMARFGADGTAGTTRIPCCAGSSGQMVQFEAVETAHASCLAGIGWRMVRFGAVGTAHTPSLACSIE